MQLCLLMTSVFIQGIAKKVMFSKLQCGFSSVEMWYEHWSIKINKDKTQAICFSQVHGSIEAHLTLNGRSL
jgi:hypothetical protein